MEITAEYCNAIPDSKDSDSFFNRHEYLADLKNYWINEIYIKKMYMDLCCLSMAQCTIQKIEYFHHWIQS